MAGGDQALGFLDGVFDWLACEGGTELGDDAVGAMGVAAVLDFEEGALAAGLVFAKEREGGGAGRARIREGEAPAEPKII